VTRGERRTLHDSNVLFVAGSLAIASVLAGVVVAIARVGARRDLVLDADRSPWLLLPAGLAVLACLTAVGYAGLMRVWTIEMTGAAALALVGLVAPFSLLLVAVVAAGSLVVIRLRN
jgi:hypothetical protein